jgi:branched-chain amino acid transport system substrate-binding protein
MAIVAAAALGVASSAAAQELRIGFLNTATGGGAIIGKHFMNGWVLGLEHGGWTKHGDTLGGAPSKIFYVDDLGTPDVGRKEVDKFLKQDKVSIVGGSIWSHVMMTIQMPTFYSRVVILITSAPPSPLAGEL